MTALAPARSLHPRKAFSGLQAGFTLIELIVVAIILAVLAVVAVPRFIDMARNARLAALSGMTGAVWGTANSIYAQCALTPPCDYGNYLQDIVFAGRHTAVNYGWPEAGDNIGVNNIDIWIDAAGFSVSVPTSDLTMFSLDGSPDPTNCAVVYRQAYDGTARRVPLVTSLTSGC
jgi:MSHA pilin protein MshA